MTWSPIPEMMWKVDPEVDAARKMPGWSQFHRECGKCRLYFDHIERQGGKRSDYVATAFTVRKHGEGVTTEKLAEGRGKTVIAAIADAYEAALPLIAATAAAPWLEMLRNPHREPEPTEASALLDNLEDLLG